MSDQADAQLLVDMVAATNEFKRQLTNIGTLSPHEKRRIAEIAQQLVCDVQVATREHVRASLLEMVAP